MLPVKAWATVYEDGSVFSSKMGSWAECPSFGVFAIVWYHKPEGVTTDRDQEVYYHLGKEAGGQEWKMGLWTDGENYWRLHDLVSKLVTP